MFFSAANGTFSKIDHILGQSKAQQIEKIWNNPLYHIRSQWNKTRPQQQKKPQKISKHVELKNTLLKDQWVIKEIREEIKKFLKSN
jgi:hypothetical protein